MRILGSERTRGDLETKGGRGGTLKLIGLGRTRDLQTDRIGKDRGRGGGGR